MNLYIIKSIVRFLGIAGLAVVLPLAAYNSVVQNQWIIFSLGIFLALNIIFNEPTLPKPTMSDDIKRIDPNEFMELGYLQEVNRQFLHPLGLALEVVIDDKTGKVIAFGGVWDYREDHEGLSYLEIDPLKAARVQVQWHEKEQERIKRLGYIIQPV